MSSNLWRIAAALCSIILIGSGVILSSECKVDQEVEQLAPTAIATGPAIRTNHQKRTWKTQPDSLLKTISGSA